MLTHKEDQEVEVTLLKRQALHCLQMFHLVRMDLPVGMDRLWRYRILNNVGLVVAVAVLAVQVETPRVASAEHWHQEVVMAVMGWPMILPERLPHMQLAVAVETRN
jgi:hypothetical protein